jgi:hypothetical protein
MVNNNNIDFDAQPKTGRIMKGGAKGFDKDDDYSNDFSKLFGEEEDDNYSVKSSKDDYNSTKSSSFADSSSSFAESKSSSSKQSNTKKGKKTLTPEEIEAKKAEGKAKREERERTRNENKNDIDNSNVGVLFSESKQSDNTNIYS